MAKTGIKLFALIQELPLADWGWTLNEKWNFDPWSDSDDLGMNFELGDNHVSPDILRWFRQREWCLEISRDGICYVAPLVCRDPPQWCFHTTPGINVAGIQRLGLLTAEAAGHSTSNRAYCADRIYVSLDETHAPRWGDSHLLGKDQPSQEWAIFRIDGRGVPGGMYRDPLSQTGYILDDKRVEPTYLTLARLFRPDNATTGS